jgi:nucleoside-diphosphate-sugar epimerase
MKIIVTGANGKIGREAVAQLRADGHQVNGWDITGAGTRVDCTDFGQVFGALSGVDPAGGQPDAVLHLAGIPSPGLAPDHITFEANTLSTYNVFSACQRLGVRRVVWASSETVFGPPFTSPPTRVPLDESSPDRPAMSYSLAKLLGERMAEQFTRWQPDLSIASLRFSHVYDEADYARLRANPSLLHSRAANLWSYIDVRDAASACVCALTADLSGHDIFVIAAADTLSPLPSAELLKERFPETSVEGDIAGYRSLQNTARAERLLGWRARHSWRDAAG